MEAIRKTRKQVHNMRATARRLHLADLCRDQDGRCAECGKPMKTWLIGVDVCDADAPSIDHILPIFRGGTNERSNLEAVHIRCNHKRNERDWPRQFGVRLNIPTEWATT